MTRTPNVLRATAVALVLSLGVAGCGAGEDDEATSPAPSGSQSATTEPPAQVPAAPPEAQPTSGTSTQDPTRSTSAPDDVSGTSAPPEGAPEVGELGDEKQAIIKTATGFIVARENQWSHQHKSPLDWLEEARPYVTDSYYKSMKERINPEGSAGAEWSIAHDKGYAVKARVSECGVNVASGVDDESNKTVQCAVTDLVVDKDGNQVPTTQIPLEWTRVGSQPVAMLLIVKQGDKWLVDQDGTGMVS